MVIPEIIPAYLWRHYDAINKGAAIDISKMARFVSSQLLSSLPLVVNSESKNNDALRV
jgi:hypothetical protein